MEESKEEPADSGNSKKEQLMQLIQFNLAMKHMKNDKEPAELFDFLFIGSIGAGLNKQRLLEIGITHVLVVADTVKPPHPNFFTYSAVHLSDQGESDLLQVLPTCFDFIDQARAAGGKVLVHW